jgi:hypothetical protein
MESKAYPRATHVSNERGDTRDVHPTKHNVAPLLSSLVMPPPAKRLKRQQGQRADSKYCTWSTVSILVSMF